MDPLYTSTGTAVEAVLVELQRQSYLETMIFVFLVVFFIIFIFIVVYKFFDKFIFKNAI